MLIFPEKLSSVTKLNSCSVTIRFEFGSVEDGAFADTHETETSS